MKDMHYSHNPNDGENKISHSGGSGSGGKALSAGVGDGLSSADMMPVKNAEKVTQNQRVVGRTSSAGKNFKIGTT